MTTRTDELREAIKHVAQLSQMNDHHLTIHLADVHRLATTFQRSVREVEIAALEAHIVPLRYIRNIGTIGIEGQLTLLRSTVAVVGQGGLGGYVTEALTRMGVGRLTLIDGDCFEAHNLNRQVLSSEEHLGSSKVAVARKRVASINSAVDVATWEEMLTRENLPRLLAEAQVVVDALDRLPIRLILQAGAQELGIPMVHGSIAGFIGQVMTILPGDPGLFQLYGELEQVPERGLEAQVGTPATTPMAVAAWEAQEVVKLLLGTGTLLRHRLLILDMASGTVETVALSG